MNHAPDRRHVLRLVAGLPLLVAGGEAAWAKAPVIERLIREAQPLPNISQRMDLISTKLLGIRYQANTLIGSPTLPEKFVVRDDAFDCVTYCEVVLAAAMARDMDGFEAALRRIRYDQGAVQYDRRNHYFADWCRRNIDNGVCRPVAIEPSIVIDKIVTWHREFGRHQVSMTAVATSTLMDNARKLLPGDIIGFTSRREGLDYYHTGLIAFGKNGELMLRNASQKRGRVVEDRMADFAAANKVAYVTLLRPADAAPVAERR